jgi:phage tail protein X
MRRYDNIPTQARFDGKRVYKTTYYPPVPPQDTDLQIVSNEGDYLDTLAYKYYGDPTLAWIIASVNNLGKGRFSIPIGTNLRIPVDVNQIIDQFNKANA